MILQQPFYKLCIGIDLVNDNQYRTILINSATRECSTNPVVKQLLFLYSQFYKVTMLESTNAIDEEKMQMYF